MIPDCRILVLYSKPGCHLCEGLEEKLRQLPEWSLQLRDITTHAEWWERYQYEIPVLAWLDQDQERILPRIPPRSSVEQIRRLLERALLPFPSDDQPN